MRKARRNPYRETPRMKRRRAKLLVLVGSIATVVVALLGTTIFLLPRMVTRAADATVNQNCTLIVPAQPLTAQGLATPYQLKATDPAQGPCNESNTAQSAFVQGVIYDPTTGAFSVYNPLIIDKGTQPALKPTVPTLPQGAIVGLWFGFNANNLLLHGAQSNTLAQAHCVNGLGDSLFTQYAYCNAVAFFAAVNQGIVAGRVHVPALGTARDGQTCPTVRDFSVVDQDQSDNVQTQYLSLPDGQIAQFSAANQAALPNATVLDNPSDNALLTRFIDPTLGCTEWEAPNLADNGSPVATLALDELQASVHQQAPIALVPLNDPMTTIAVGNNNEPSLAKTNLYRLGVDQIPAVNNHQASGAAYCTNLLKTGMPRLVLDRPLTIKAPTPDAGAANNLFTFLAQRFQASYNNLNCPMLLNIPNPVKTKTDKKGVVISASFNGQGSGTPVSQDPDCVVNGQTIHGCMGTATINGQTCTFSFANQTIMLNCPEKSN
jgi:hypothetical protein